MIIRPARFEDAPSMARVHLQCWREAYAGIISDAFLKNLNLAERINGFEGLLGPGYSGSRFNLVAETSEEGVIGFAAGGEQRDAAYKARFDGELWALYLLKSQQRRGVGRNLFNQVRLQLKAKGFKSMLTWALKENPACGFYLKMGGVEAGSKKIVIDREHEELAIGWESI